MQLEELRELTKELRREKLTYTTFQARVNDVVFDIYYSIQFTPFRLLIVQIGSDFSIDIEVNNGFNINPFIKDFSKLCKILQLKYDSQNIYKPSYFFETIIKQVPQQIQPCNNKNELYPYVVTDKKERNDGIYYFKKINWTKKTRSKANSEKIAYWYPSLYKIIENDPTVSIAFTDREDELRNFNDDFK